LETETSATQNIITALLKDLEEIPAAKSCRSYFPTQHFTALPAYPSAHRWWTTSLSLQSHQHCITSWEL